MGTRLGGVLIFDFTSSRISSRTWSAFTMQAN